MDIVEYIENIYNYPLLDVQKDFIRKEYDAIKNNKQIICIPPRHSAFTSSFELLRAVIISINEKELGLVGKELE